MRALALAVPAAILLALTAGPVRSQQTAAGAQPVVPGARAELVQLDVVVTDASGALVRSLNQEDFQVLEDGQTQKVAQFFVVNRPSAAAPAAAAPAAVAPSAPAPASAAEGDVSAGR